MYDGDDAERSACIRILVRSIAVGWQHVALPNGPFADWPKKLVVTQAREKERGVSLRRNAGAGNYTLED